MQVKAIPRQKHALQAPGWADILSSGTFSSILSAGVKSTVTNLAALMRAVCLYIHTDKKAETHIAYGQFASRPE